MAKDIVLGRGKLYFGKFLSSTNETHQGLEYIGNTPSFSLTVETQELDHYDSDEGLKVKDESITLQVDYSGTLVTDAITTANLARFFFGSSTTVAQSSATNEQWTGTVYQNSLYHTGARSISNVTVTGSGGTPSYTEGTDYTLNLETGTFTIVADGGIASGTAIEVNYDQGAVSHDQVSSGKEPLSGELYFESFNPVGPKRDVQMQKVVMRPNGEFQMKGDEWQQMTFNVEVLAKGSEPEVIMNGRPYTP